MLGESRTGRARRFAAGSGICASGDEGASFAARRRCAGVCVLVALMLASVAHGAPEGGRAVHGDADIQQDGATTTITTSRDAILRFDSFDLSREEAVRFVQPDAGSRVLNKINGSAPSRIDGSIWSNGTVYLVNPAGVMFGSNAVVDVAGFYAGAANLSDSDFLGGVDRFTATGDVVNRGTIRAERVALIGRRVANLGAIHAPQGMVAFAAGEKIMLSDRDRRIYIRIEEAAGGVGGASPPEAPGADAEVAVTNAGTIDASGGGVSWGAGDMYAVGLRQSAAGSVRAETVHAEAGPSATAEIGGRIDASHANGRGGEVAVTAGRVEVRGEIDASGSAGGGAIHLGGGRRGGTDLPHASVTRVHGEAALRADATDRGDGGEIVAYADRFTAFAGDASARGGSRGGDGGFVEVSAEGLHFAGEVDLAAPDGRAGTLLFDPTDINIVDGSGGADDGDLPDLSDATRGAGTFEISEQALEGLAANANLVLEATNDITVADIADDLIALPIDATGSVRLVADFDTDGAGEIVFSDPSDVLRTEGGSVSMLGFDLTLGAIDTTGASGTVAGGTVTIQSGSTFEAGLITTDRVELLSEASIGASGSPIRFAGATEIILDAEQNVFVEGDGVTSPTLLSLSVDPGGAFSYEFDALADESLSGDANAVVADGSGNLLINSARAAGGTSTRYSFTAKTGNLEVDNAGGAGGIVTGGEALDLTTLAISGDGDINIGQDGVSTADGAVTLRATAAPDGSGGLQAPTGAPGLGSGDVNLGVNAIDAGAGEVGLFAGGAVDETDPDDTLQLVNITTTDRLFIRARGEVGDAASVGDETIPTESHLDVDVDRLNAESTAGGNLVIKDQGAGGMTLERAVVSGSGFVRVDSVATMTVPDGAAFSPGSFVWLASEAGIVEPAGDDPAVANAIAGGNVRFDAEGAIGEAADPFDVDAAGLFALVGQGAFGGTEGAAGGIFVTNLGTDFDVFQLQVFDGEIAIETPGDMVIDGAPFFSPARDPQFEPFEMDNPGDITLTSTGGTVTIQNADLDDPSGFDNFANLTVNGPTVVTLNPQFFDSNNQLAQAGNALFQGETVAVNGPLTVESTLTGFEIDATGDVTVAGAALFEAPAQQAFQLPAAIIAGDNVAFNDTLTSAIGFRIDAAGDFAVAGAAEFTQPDPAPFQPSTAVIEAATATFNDALTTAIGFQVDAAGNITLVGAGDFGSRSILDGADVSFDSPVSLGGRMDVIADNAAFNDTVASGGNGDHALQVDTGGDGVTEFFGEIGNAGANPLFTLTTNDDGVTIVHDDVFTRGRQAYFNHLELVGDITLTDAASLDADGNPAALEGSGVFFETVGSDGTPRRLTVVTETDPAALQAIAPRVGLIGFFGDVGVDRTGAATAGARLSELRLNPAGSRPAPPAVATIAAGVREAAGTADFAPTGELGFDVHVENTFVMGLNEKMTVLGDATLNLNRAGAGPGNVVGRLSDINATGRLAVDANGADVVLLDHGPSPTGLLRADDRNTNGQLDDFLDGRGLDFWAADAIAFTNVDALTTAGGGGARFVSTSRSNITGVAGFIRESVTPFPALFRVFDGQTVALDPALQPIFDLGRQLPRRRTTNLGDRTLTPPTAPAFAAASTLRALDTGPGGRLAEAIEAAIGDALALDPGASGGPGGGVRRLRADALPDAVEAYRRTFYAPTAGPGGETVWRPRFEELRGTLAEGIEAYRVATGEKPASPRALRRFFEQTGEGAAALAVLDALRAVYLEVYQLGLTETQWSRAVYQLARPITPEGYSADFVNQAALGQGR